MDTTAADQPQQSATRAWWLALVYVVIALNVVGLVLIGLRDGDGVGIVVFLAGAALGVAGLRIRSTNAVLGSWMIVAACIPPALPVWLVLNVVLSVVTIIAGVVTRQLQLVPASPKPSSE